MRLGRPTAILFDWDNTLVDGWAAIAVALNAVFARRGAPLWSAEEARANVRGSARDSFPAMFGTDWEREAALFYAVLADEHLAQLRPVPGAEALLDVCGVVPCAVVSNKAGAFLRREVSHLGWDGFFGAVVGSGDSAADKPQPEPLLLALARLGVQAGPDIWYVGDTVLDMNAARAAGCRALLVGDAGHDGGVAGARADANFCDAFQLAGEIAALAL